MSIKIGTAAWREGHGHELEGRPHQSGGARREPDRAGPDANRWAVIGDIQQLPGYSLLLYAGDADHLTDLPRTVRAAFLLDLSLLGEAVQAACTAVDPTFRRVNYEVLGNSWHHLHGHVHARYDWEPAEHRSGPVWRYGEQRRRQRTSTRHPARTTPRRDHHSATEDHD